MGLVNLSRGSPNFSAILSDFLDSIGLNALSVMIGFDLFYNDYVSICVVIGFSTLWQVIYAYFYLFNLLICANSF